MNNLKENKFNLEEMEVIDINIEQFCDFDGNLDKSLEYTIYSPEFGCDYTELHLIKMTCLK